MPSWPIEPPDEKPVPPLKRCQSFRAGHSVHWIQALHSANKPAVVRRIWSAVIVELASDGLTVEREDGTRVRFLNHDMKRLSALCGGVGSTVRVSSQYAVLRVPSPDGAYCFSVAVDRGKPLDPCSRGTRR